MTRPLFFLAALSFSFSLSPTPLRAEPEDALIVEIIKRVGDFDIAKASPKVKAALSRFVAQNRGTASYFDSVERYQMASEVPELLKIIATAPKSQAAASASKTLLSIGATAELEKAMTALAPAAAPDFLEAVIKSNKREAADLLLGLVTKPDQKPELQAAALQAFGKSRNAENSLLKALQDGKIPAALKFQAAQVLHASNDPKTRTAAEAIMPLPKSQGDKPLPPIASLVKMSGNAKDGQAAYGKYCMTCHQIGETGINFGPALSEIGSKLAKEALYQNILEPNAAISFGFEGWEIKTKAGDSYLGMIAGQTADELSVKVPGGVILKVAKADVTEKKALPVSLMTPGLAGVMTQEELVSLVEYLTTLKKK